MRQLIRTLIQLAVGQALRPELHRNIVWESFYLRLEQLVNGR